MQGNKTKLKLDCYEINSKTILTICHSFENNKQQNKKNIYHII